MKRAALTKAKAELTAARLDALAVPGDALAAPRAAALERVRALGLPHARDEYWKYTRPERLTAAAPEAAQASTEAQVFDEALTLVFTDGVFDAAASDDPAQAGLVVARLADAPDWAAQSYGAREAAGQTPVARPLMAFNTAFAQDGLVIDVTAPCPKPIRIRYVSTGQGDAVLHHLVRLAEGAELTLLEEGLAGARANIVLEAEISDTAALHHIRVQGREDDRALNTGLFARLGRESVFKSFTLTMNGALTRNEAILELTGDDAVAHVAGACLGDGGAFHHDDTVFITHDAVNCESRQVFKKVLRNGATGVFQGKILVKEGAQKTDGYQISQSLLLDEDSQFLAKPELEIYADDVACSHGSTSGAIDEEALFYLRARGVPRREATDMLTLAFLAEALDEIEDEALSERMLELLQVWMAR